MNNKIAKYLLVFIALFSFRADINAQIWNNPVEKVIEYHQDSIYKIVETDAKPIGGVARFYRSISINFPNCIYKDMKIMGNEGRLLFQFVIDAKGELLENSFKLLRPINLGTESCLKEFESIIHKTKWDAGKVDGKNVKQRITFSMIVCLD